MCLTAVVPAEFTNFESLFSRIKIDDRGCLSGAKRSIEELFRLRRQTALLPT